MKLKELYVCLSLDRKKTVICAAAAAIVGIMAVFAPEVRAAEGDVNAETGTTSVWEPAGICSLGDGEFLVTDTFSKVIWKVKDGKRSLYAGRSGIKGLYGEPEGGRRDGSPMELQLRSPWEIIPYMDGFAVSDSKNNMIRYITGTKARTAAGEGKEGYEDGRGGRALFSGPTGLACAPDGTLYIADTGNDVIRSLSPSGQVDTYVRNLSSPTGLCFYDGALYVADTGNHRILKVVDGAVVWSAGSGNEGYHDGRAEEAQFSSPQRITAADDGTLYVSDTGNSLVRKITGGVVETVPAGGESQGDGTMAEPAGLWAGQDSLLVCDSFSRKIHILPR